jgi:[acyl-carrier-protein] S-malonyltransferase
MNKAFIFPGQGSQSIGMAKDFYDSEPEAQKTFSTVDKALGYNLSDLIFNGSIEELSVTTNTQPAIMAASIAILRVLLAKTNKKIEDLCRVVAGHSLGEYSALCASGALELEETATLLKTRASSMQDASPKGQGAMAACINISHVKLQEIINDLIKEGVCQIANDNVEGQIVISGHNYNIDRIVAVLKDLGYRAIKLNVSAPFHSNLIKAAEIPMKQALATANFNNPSVPVISNVTVAAETDINLIKDNLLRQICGARTLSP